MKSTYVLLIVNNYVHSYSFQLDVFKFVFGCRSPPPRPFSKSLLLFRFNVSKRKSNFEYCSENMLEEFLIQFSSSSSSSCSRLLYVHSRQEANIKIVLCKASGVITKCRCYLLAVFRCIKQSYHAHPLRAYRATHRRICDIKFYDFINGCAALMMTFRSIDSGL